MRDRPGLEAVDEGGYDVLILDGEAGFGGVGLAPAQERGLDCPPIVVLTGRPVDGWLATWSLADAAVPRPLDPEKLADTVAHLARR